MTTSTNFQHYLRAIVGGIAKGTLLVKLQRYLSSRQVDHAIMKHYGLRIQNGPFAGMKYIIIPPYRGLPAKLLGSYERELHPAIEAAIKTGYNVIINVGSAEGCYAVGYAVKVPGSSVYAFDVDPREQEFCRQLAEVNQVSHRVHISGLCTAEDLQNLISGSTLVIMDCEGCEFSLLKPNLVPNLSHADIIVELHDFGDGSLKSELQARFADTHVVTEIQFEPRHVNEYAEVQFLTNVKDKELAIMDRDVLSQSWFYLQSK